MSNVIKKETEQVKKGYREQIDDLLANYVDGDQIFIKPDDWQFYDVELIPEPEADTEQHASWMKASTNWMMLQAQEAEIVAREKYGLDFYENRIRVITSNQMIDLYSTVGMPEGYAHWSYGKHRESTAQAYNRGNMGLAFEIVINSDPTEVYCMEENTKTMQMLVTRHAGIGHNSFFKGNYLFRQHTCAQTIISDIKALKKFAEECEERFGEDEVTKIMDAAHALMNYGVDRYQRPMPRSEAELAAERAESERVREENIDEFFDRPLFTEGLATTFNAEAQAYKEPDYMEENLLRYIVDHAPNLELWQRKLIKGVSDMAQYFYPQRQTQVMNEGWATFWHYTMMRDEKDMGLIDDGMYLEFLKSHTSVVFQPGYDSPYYNGINPYALGFAMYTDLRRICEDPTEEDRRWFPDIAGQEWLPVLKRAMRDYKDESFIAQFLSPKVIRDLKLFAILDDDKRDDLLVPAIHDDEGYEKIRQTLSRQYNLGDREPRLESVGFNNRGDRAWTLRHSILKRKPLGDTTQAVLEHMRTLWQHPIILHSVDEAGVIVQTTTVPASAAAKAPKAGERLRYDIR